MEYLTLYDLISSKLPHWIDAAKEKDLGGYGQKGTEILQELTPQLTEKNKELLMSYSLAVRDRMEYIYQNVNIKLLNFGIKIGMELQKSFNKFEED